MKNFKTPDILFYETDDSCALCGARNSDLLSNLLTVHHIDENRENNTYDNLIVLCSPCHTSYHKPASKEPTRENIEKRKRNLIHKTLTTFGLNAMKIASRNKFGVVGFPYMLYHLCELGYMKKEEAQMGYGDIEDVTARFSITEHGEKVLEKWFGKK